MAAEKKRSRKKSPRKTTNTPVNREDGSQVSLKKRWVFRLLAAVFVPLVLLCLVEFILRIAGAGYDPSYFVEKTIRDETVLVPNEAFSRRFFPRNLARSPNTLVLQPEKKPGTKRIFVFGESAALGDPRPGFGFPRYLETLLNARYSGVEFEVVCVAMTAINSHAVLSIAEECADLDGDLWLVYMGNNEMVGPFGVAGVFGSSAPSYARVRSYLALKKLKTVQVMVDLVETYRESHSEPRAWEGLKMFLDRPIAPDHPGKGNVYANFKANYENILDLARDRGLPVIASSMVSALRDFGPFQSYLHEELSEEELRQIDDLIYDAIGRGDSQTNQVETLALVRSQYPDHAGLAFALGQAHFKVQQWDAGRDPLFRARDLDALPFRSDSQINSLIAEVVGAYGDEGVQFFDAETWLANASPMNVPGSELFFDHVHFNFLGNYLMALGCAEQVKSALASSLPNPEEGSWLDQKSCEEVMGVTAWNKEFAYETMVRRLQVPPFTGRIDHTNHLFQLRLQLTKIHEGVRPDLILPARDVYERAVLDRPHDFRLREAYAEFLEAVGDNPGSLDQWKAVRDILPFHFGPWYHMGRLQRMLGELDLALTHLQKANTIRPDSIEIELEINKCLVEKGETEKALENYRRLEASTPNRSDIQYYMAHIFAIQGDREEAMTRLRKAIELNSGNWQARYLLGVELAADGQLKEAADEFRAVVGLNPEYSLAHYNLGNTYARVGMLEQAQKAFTETLRLDPQNLEALDRLRMVRELIDKAGPQK